MKRIVTTIIIFFIQLNYIFSQQGSPFIKNFDPFALNITSHTMDVKQDSRGVMYFGGVETLLEYDGKNWKQIEIPARKPIYSMAFDSTGTLYVGSQGEFGYFSPNNLGEMKYTSLSQKLDTCDNKFFEIWHTIATKDGIYFFSYEELFRYKPQAGKSVNECLKTWKFEKNYFMLYYVHDSLYVSGVDGMLCMHNDSLRPVYGTEFSKRLDVWLALPYENHKILCFNIVEGLFVYDTKAKDSTKRILTRPYLNEDKLSEVNNFLIENELYSGIKLNNGNYALGTISGGIIIINPKGEIIRKINKNDGLQNNTIHNLFQDNQGGLWAALGYGTSRIEVSSPFSYWGGKDDLEGVIASVCKYKKNVYVGTDIGIYQLKDGKFEALDRQNKQQFIECNALESVKTSDNKQQLLGVSSRDFFEILDNNLKEVSEDMSFFLCHSKINLSRVYMANNFELKYIEYKNGTWTDSKTIVEMDEYPLYVYEEDADKLWVIALDKPYFIKFSENNKLYSPSLSNLPEDIQFLKIVDINNKMTFLTNYGLYYFENQSFVRDTLTFDGCLNNFEIEDLKSVGKDSYYALIATKDNLTEKKLGLISKENGKYNMNTTPYKRLNNIENFYIDEDTNLWVLSPKELYKMHKTEKKYDIPINTLIRSVKINEDSIIFAGTYSIKDRICLDQPKSFIPKLEYKSSISFEFAMPSYDKGYQNLYQHALCRNGEDTEWSHWSKATQKDYTNLSEGKYVFKVKSKNIFGNEGSIAEYSFTIARPWYRAFWVYALYVVLFVLLVYYLVKLKTNQLVKRNEKLEETVQERTAEIQSIADSLKEANQEILLSHKELKAKNKQITASIEYAKLIQKAAMPKNEDIKKLLPSHFIFFKPRDIVSGDYYWVREIKGLIIVVVADCTGHGIPGAFMSMLGISLYNEIARRTEIDNVAKSLDVLRRELKSTLGQTGESIETQDGIDLAVISIDRKKRILEYAGAHNPIFIVSDNKLKQYKADRMPVGISPMEKPFTNHIIDIKVGDQIYMFSDGYVDQFGGKINFKFTRKRLEKLLYENKHKSMQEQYEIIKETHEKWAGNKKQLDDILVVGIKIEEEMFGVSN